MKIINIVDEVSDINHGIWHAAVVNAYLLKSHGYKVELWYPKSNATIPADVEGVQIDNTTIATLKALITQRQLKANTDIIITHGLWQFPTRWGYYLKKAGFRWVYVPQGMLEPWPLKQKWLKKKIYFNIAEKRMAGKADIIRAVSEPESINLQKFFPRNVIKFIPNGVSLPPAPYNISSPSEVSNYLFLSRLHHKKNILALADAWLISSLNNRADKHLYIAGPDQGELGDLKSIIKRTSNITYLGTVRGKAKEELFAKCDFFVLPSFSEGLPSALLESMGAGLVPIISTGCNLPEVFSRKLGFKVSTDRESISLGLEKSAELEVSVLNQLKLENFQFIKNYFSVEAITATQTAVYLRPAL